MAPHMAVGASVGVKDLGDIIHWACCNGNGLHFGKGEMANKGQPKMGWKCDDKDKLYFCINSDEMKDIETNNNLAQNAKQTRLSDLFKPDKIMPLTFKSHPGLCIVHNGVTKSHSHGMEYELKLSNATKDCLNVFFDDQGHVCNADVP